MQPAPNSTTSQSDLDAQSHYALFCKRFGEACGRGPGAMLTYLNEKLAQTDRSLQNVAYKFAAVDEINAEVMKEVNAAINRTQRIKTGAEVAFPFLSTFGGGPLATGTITWAKNTALGVALTVGTEFASTLGEIQAADLVTFAYDVPDAIAKGAKNLPSQSNIASNVTGELPTKCRT